METKEVVGLALQLVERDGNELANELLAAYSETECVASESGEIDTESLTVAYPEYTLKFGVEDGEPAAALTEGETERDSEAGHEGVFEFIADYVHPDDRATVWSMLNEKLNA